MVNNNLDATINALQKNYGKSIVTNLGDDMTLEREVIPTGILGLDIALGGGLVKGRTIECYGSNSCGKTTVALHAIAAAQKIGTALFVDVEHSFDRFYAKNLGVDVDNLLFSQPSYAEQAFEVIEALAATGSISLIVLDSVAALSPRAEIMGDAGDSNMGLIARLIGQHLRKITPIISTNKVIILYLNQIRSNLGVMFGPKEVTPGGNAIKFMTSIRMDIRRKKILKTADDKIGIESLIRIVKNKTYLPFKEATIEIKYGKGVDKIASLIDIAKEKNILVKKGAWYYFEGENIAQGLDNTIELLKNDVDLLQKVTNLTLDSLKTGE